MENLSVIVPVFNEEENLPPLYQELKGTLDATGHSYEVIFIDDGSRDSSWKIIKEFSSKDPRVKGIKLRKNFGQTPAMMAGFHEASGEIIITMDADRQNDPKDIPRLLKKLGEGHDIISGWRKKRKDPFFTRKLPSIIANWLISLVTGLHLHDYGCTLKAYRSEVVKNLELYGQMHRFIPAVASNYGVDVVEIEVNHRARLAGKSKYGLSRTFKVILDLISLKFLLSYSTRPLHIFGSLGIASFSLGLISGLYLIYVKYIKSQPISNRPLLSLTVLLIITGIQLIVLGLLGELITRTYHESSGKKTYAVKEKIGF